MSLSARDKLLYARHLLLPEVGHGGQERLCAAELVIAEGADPRAAEVATEYLARSGCSVRRGGAEGVVVPAPGPEEVEALAGDGRLREAAAALAGAFAAVEAIKGVLEVGRPARLDGEPRLG